nr:uncharacterized protein LOC112038033 [Quercus suber]
MDDNFDDVTISTFKNSLPTEHGLRKSLTSKTATSVRQLIDRIDKYKRVEEDQVQGRGKEKVIPQERRDFRSDQYNSNHPKRDFVGQSGATNIQAISAIFQEPEPLELSRPASPRRKTEAPSASFQWSSRPNLSRAPERYDPESTLGTINVILAAPGRTGTRPSRVLSVAQLHDKESQPEPKRVRRNFHPTLSFSEEDKIGTSQPHDDALIITLRIGRLEKGDGG